MSFFLKLFIIALIMYAVFLILAAYVEKDNTKKVFNFLHTILLTLVLGLGLFALGVQIIFKDAVFARPWMLALIFPVLLFGIAYFLFSQGIEGRVSYNIYNAYDNTNLFTIAAKFTPFVMTIAAVIFLLTALAGPRNMDRTVLPPMSGVDIILTLDTSGSMDNRDFIPNRMTAAKVAAAKFIEKRVSDRIGIVVFGGAAMLQSPLTLDYESLLDFLELVNIGMVDRENTAIGDALAVSVNHIRESSAKSKIIVLLTDGANNAGSITPELAAKAAESYGIKVYTIATIGPHSTEEFDEGLLRRIAADTGGRFYRAYNTAELGSIYASIDALEKTEFKESVILNYKDKYFVPLAVGIALLILAFILNKFIFLRIP
ncbi:Ca-activated chloride channel family protein [Parelusimicrobium proximum]|uniref:VWA domain-containing protein n=1 Tax=Parelusimicrobium proximum TaxID=3228953 RepID=UPI003D1694D9